MRNGVHSISEAARLIGVNHRTLYENIRSKNVPPPAVVVGKRRYYTPTQIPDLQKHFVGGKSIKVKNGLYNLAETAALAGITVYALKKLRESEQVSLGTLVSRRYYFTDADIPAIRLAATYKPPVGWQSKMPAKGLYNRVRAAAALKIPHVTLENHIRKGWVPKQTNIYKGHMYYSQSDIEALREWYAVNYKGNYLNRKHVY